MNVFKGLRTEDVQLSRLVTGVFTPRLEINERYVGELAESMRSEGQLKPIIVRELPDEYGWFQVVDGEHRVRAAQRLGWEAIRAEVHGLGEVESLFMAMRVNMLHGLRLTEMDEAYHIKRLHDRGLSTTEIAEMFDMTHPWVLNRLRLVEKAAPEVREAVVKRFTAPTVAMQISRLPKETQVKVVRRQKQFGGLTWREAKRLVNALEAVESDEERERVLTMDKRELAELEEDVVTREAMKVQAPCEVCGEVFPAPTLWEVMMCANCRIFFDKLFDKLTGLLSKPRLKVTRHDVERVEMSLKPVKALVDSAEGGGSRA